MVDQDTQIQLLQLYGQGLLSRRTVLEKLEVVDDVDQEVERLEEQEAYARGLGPNRAQRRAK